MNMDKQILYPLIGKPLKVKLSSGFILYGTIDQISDDFVVFTTTQKSSILHHTEILSLVPV